jgi:dolichol-phosphate mannosyltransferase
MTQPAGRKRAADLLRTVVVVPTYNERENFEELLGRTIDQGAGVEALVVDDNSPDGTGDLVAGMAAAEPRVHLLRRPGKLGLGTAHIAGFRWALARNYERIITIDADFSHPPERIPAMLEASLECDLVIGSRYIEGGGHENWPRRRVFLSSMSNLVARTALRLEPADCTGAYRCFGRGLLEQIAFDNIVSLGYSFQEEMLWHCSHRGFRICEVPITFRDRRAGQSKISPREVWGGMSTIARLMFTPQGRKQPPGPEQAVC